jgi:DNA topoisomerase-6 subunit A
MTKIQNVGTPSVSKGSSLKEIKSKRVINTLKEIPELLYSQMLKKEVPKLLFKSRTMKNLDKIDDIWQYGDKESLKTSQTKGGISQLLKLLYTIEFLISIQEQKNTVTLRELYYYSESWNYAKFKTQQESNYLVENIEVYTGLYREDLNIRPEEKGSLVGPLFLEETFKGKVKEIDCIEDVTSGYYSIPYNINNIKILKNKANFIMAVETGGMFERLVEANFHIDYNCILVDLKGQPSRSTKAIIKLISNSKPKKLPVIVFTDGDPWSYRIFASIAYGSVKSAHLSSRLVTPGAHFIGILPSDIEKYQLPFDKLSRQDVLALEQELKDKRFEKESKKWEEEIKLQLKINKKSEQQSLAKFGLSFVVETYLPDKLKELNII